MEERDMRYSRFGKPHGDKLRAALTTEETPEVIEAREHVDSCAACQGQLAHVFGILDEAGVLSPPRSGRRSHREVANSFRRRAFALKAKESEVTKPPDLPE